MDVAIVTTAWRDHGVSGMRMLSRNRRRVTTFVFDCLELRDQCEELPVPHKRDSPDHPQVNHEGYLLHSPLCMASFQISAILPTAQVIGMDTVDKFIQIRPSRTIHIRKANPPTLGRQYFHQLSDLLVRSAYSRVDFSVQGDRGVWTEQWSRQTILTIDARACLLGVLRSRQY